MGVASIIIEKYATASSKNASGTFNAVAIGCTKKNDINVQGSTITNDKNIPFASTFFVLPSLFAPKALLIVIENPESIPRIAPLIKDIAGIIELM
jgi:hypothetical protein